MYFLVNPKSKRRPHAKTVKRRAIPKKVRRGLRAKAKAAGQQWFGVNPKHGAKKMATRRRRRRATVKRAAPRRRRRRRSVALARRVHANPPRRRRRRRVYRANARHRVRHARRRFRRNPGLGSARGIVNGVVEGVKDGLAVVAGQVATRKLAAGVTAMLPPASDPRVKQVQYIGFRLGAAVAVSLVARKVSAKYARIVTAGAFSEAINAALAQTPVAPFLAAIPTRRVVPVNRGGVSAYPRGLPRGGGMSAYPRSVGLPFSVGS